MKPHLLANQLRTELLPEPCGIVNAPEFNWILKSDQPDVTQTACELEVDLLLPDEETRPAWRTGKLKHGIGTGVCYSGYPLRSRSSYRWRVRVWDEKDQAGAWSPWTFFFTGVIAPDSIAANWISGGGAMKRDFLVSGGLLRGRAYVSGLGYYEFLCNGRKVSSAALAPSFTEFERRVEYEVIDLTADLQTGLNTAGFLLGDGWWRHGREARERKANQAIGEIVLEYADGRREVVKTDDSWLAAPGPLPDGENTSPLQIFDGVTLDLAWLASGWCNPGANTNGWHPAEMAGAGAGELVPSLLPPVREVETLRPRAVNKLSESLLVVDFGQNFTGWVRFRASAARGTRLTVRQAELLKEDGRLNTETLRQAKQTDTYLLAGDAGGETVEPRFVYHGFRYAEIAGPLDALDAESIAGCVVHTALDPVGEITTSDDRINWLLNALRWTIRSNAFSVMTDVCQRDERRGWLMDGVTALKAGAFFYDMQSLARKWIDDMIDIQEADGSLTADAAPAWFPCKSVGWQRAIVLAPWTLYETYGDCFFLRRAFPHMCRYADYLLNNLKENLLPDGFSHHPAEWLCVARRDARFADNMLAVDVFRKVAKASRQLGEDGRAYDEAAARVADAAHRCWYDQRSACYSAGEGFAQSGQIYALRFGVPPPAERQRVFDRLVDDLMNARGEGPFVTTGIGSTEHLPTVLSEFGRDDLVWRWLQRDDYPGYGFMQHCGATTIWERWEQMNYHQMNAHNHTGLTGIGTWLMNDLIGIRVVPAPEPVFDLRPAVHLPLESLSARWRSRWGEVLIAWQSMQGIKKLAVTIPPGCVGHLRLHGQQGSSLSVLPGTHEWHLPKTIST